MKISVYTVIGMDMVVKSLGMYEGRTEVGGGERTEDLSATG